MLHHKPNRSASQSDPMKSFVAKSTWILEHSDDYILCGWKLLSVVASTEFIAAVLLIVARAMVGDTTNAAAKYNCKFVLRDKFLVPYENPAGSDGTCSEATIYLDRGNSASVVCIIFLFISVLLDAWTPIRKREHGFCECNRLNVMCGAWVLLSCSWVPLICGWCAQPSWSCDCSALFLVSFSFFCYLSFSY